MGAPEERVKALELAESLWRARVAAGLWKEQAPLLAKRVVETAEVFFAFLDPEDAKLVREIRNRRTASAQGSRLADDVLASSNGGGAPRPSATDTQHVGGPASAPAAPVERHERAVVQRVLGHPIDSTGLTPDGRPVFTSGIERDTLDVIRDAHRVPDQATRAVVKQVTDKALLAAGITPETPGAVFYLTEAEGRALVDELDALLADGAPQADVPPPAPAASSNDAWLGAMTLLDTAIVRANAKGKRQELIDLICNVNHAARIEDVPPDALEAAAQEVEGLVGALGTGLIGLLRDRAAMRGR